MIVVEHSDRIVLASQAWLVSQDRELAWAEEFVRPNPHFSYILGKFVGANDPNANGHIFTVDDLRVAKDSLVYSPLNMLHRPHQIMGAYVGSELIYPTAAPGDNVAGPNQSAAMAAGVGMEKEPFLESLAAFWRFYFREEFAMVKDAHDKGFLAQSMECIPESVTCASEDCKKTFEYAGRVSETYCAHLNGPTPLRTLNKPLFTAGAIIIPPARPAWRNATVSELSSLMENELQVAASETYDQVSKEFSHLEPSDWESMMAGLLSQMHHPYKPREGAGSPCKVCDKLPAAPIHSSKTGPAKAFDISIVGIFDPEIGRSFSTAERQKLASKGMALPDGSYPTETKQDWMNARQAIGRAPASKRAALIRYLKRRAKALGISESEYQSL